MVCLDIEIEYRYRDLQMKETQDKHYGVFEYRD